MQPSPPRRLPPMHRLCGAALLLALGGCAAAPGKASLEGRERLQIERIAQRLEHSPRRIDDPLLEARIMRVLARIDAPAELRVFLLDLPSPQADVVGARLLTLRLGLLRALRNDDELAFVLAHELAHGTLGHVAARRREDWNAAAAERAADDLAQATLRGAGLRASAGAELLARLRDDVTAADARLAIAMRLTALCNDACPDGAGAPHDASWSELLRRYDDASTE